MQTEGKQNAKTKCSGVNVPDADLKFLITGVNYAIKMVKAG